MLVGAFFLMITWQYSLMTASYSSTLSVKTFCFSPDGMPHTLDISSTHILRKCVNTVLNLITAKLPEYAFKCIDVCPLLWNWSFQLISVGAAAGQDAHACIQPQSIVSTESQPWYANSQSIATLCKLLGLELYYPGSRSLSATQMRQMQSFSSILWKLVLYA